MVEGFEVELLYCPLFQFHDAVVGFLVVLGCFVVFSVFFVVLGFFVVFVLVQDVVLGFVVDFVVFQDVVFAVLGFLVVVVVLEDFVVDTAFIGFDVVLEAFHCPLLQFQDVEDFVVVVVIGFLVVVV